MPLDYSQRRLISQPLRHKGKGGTHTRRLQVYAVLTGFLSMLVSLITLIVRIVK